MLRQPRRSTQICRFKFAVSRNPAHPQLPTAHIKTRHTTRIFWYNFETLRLQLIWAMVRKRRLSKKMFFKQKKQKKKDVPTHFWSKLLKKPVTRHVWFNGFPHLPYTTKPKGGRMGKGKGSFKAFFFKAAPNHPLIYLYRCSPQQLKLISYKLKRHLPGLGLLYVPTTHRTVTWL